MRALVLLLSLLLASCLCSQLQSACDCLNGGICMTGGQARCRCPAKFIGQRCHLPAVQVSPEGANLSLTTNYSYVYFQPEEVNYYKLIFNVCMRNNPSGKQTLLYIQTEKNDGSLRQAPSPFELVKFSLENTNCTTYSTQYISIKRKEDQSFRKIVAGLRITNQEEKNSLNSLHQTMGDQSVDSESAQEVTIKMRYEVYMRTSYYGTFMILFTAFVMLLILTSLITFLKKKYTIQAIDPDSLRLTSFDLHYLARTAHRARRRPFGNPEERPRFHNKLALSNLQLFMPVVQYEANQGILGQEAKEVCSICLLEFVAGQETRMTPCKHRYHRDCIDNWWESNMSCPICRRNLDFGQEMRQFYYHYLRSVRE